MAEQICRRPRGCFLVTGPTGSGKTTTLATMINHINENFDRHIITMEDPIEYYHPHKKSIIVQREIGVDVPNFSEGLRRALRQDPDVILVGEMRDLATISSAITAAETGHLVFGTLHTSGAASTINRLIDAFPTDQQAQVRVQLAGNLIAVISQALCPRVDTDGMVAAYEFMYLHAGHSEPDPRQQELPNRLGNSDRQEVRHAVARRQPVGPLPGRQNFRGGSDR
jgi:twitching motility protein PilT